VQLYLGDCLQIMPELAGVDAVVTDPPYGIERFTKGFGYTRFKGHGAERDGLTWDKRPSDETIGAVLRVGHAHIIWGANNFRLPPSQCFLVWDKFQTVDNFASAELAFYDAIGKTAKVFRYPIHRHNQEKKFHPTQKPVPLMAWCLEQLPDDVGTVLDPFMGSGTTGVACVQTGRKFIGIEIDPGYFEIAKKRISEAQLQIRLPFAEASHGD
jgi:DNA modification methylase